VVTTDEGHLTKRRVEVFNITPVFLDWLRKNPTRLSQLSPDKFEDLIADRLSAMKFQVMKIGNTYAKDGGIDLIAWPEASPFPFCVAAQIKHRKSGSPVGPSVVREFRGVIEQQPIDIGLIVTNTRFTATAEWVAKQRGRIIKLRGFSSLRNWLYDEFFDESVWKEMPDSLELAPGMRVSLPKVLRND
jgi:Restriction endonuclease